MSVQENRRNGKFIGRKMHFKLKKFVVVNLQEFFVSFVTLFSRVFDPKGIMGIVLKCSFGKHMHVYIE